MSELTARFVACKWPRVYHVADRYALDAILERGLLSTDRLLDAVRADTSTKARVLSRHRPEPVVLSDSKYGRVVVRDQKPMNDAGLKRALPETCAPADQHELLNQRVFFWLTRERLLRFLNAGAYKDNEHLVLTLDTFALVLGEYPNVELSPMNSGATKPMAHPRDPSIFSHVSECPWDYQDRRRARKEVAVELCVRGGVSDVRPYLLGAHVMKGNEVLDELSW